MLLKILDIPIIVPTNGKRAKNFEDRVAEKLIERSLSGGKNVISLVVVKLSALKPNGHSSGIV